MKNLLRLSAVALFAGSLFTGTGLAAEAKAKEKSKAAKAYPLKTCLVSDEELGADPDMKPFSFAFEGQEIKLCCKSCKKDFDKEPKKFMTKLGEEAKKAKNAKLSGK